MATDEQLPARLKRVALLIELEDGSTVAVYAEPNPNPVPWEPKPRVTLGSEAPAERFPPYGGPRVTGPTVNHFHVDGIQEYRMATAMPAMIGATLDAIRNAVTL